MWYEGGFIEVVVLGICGVLSLVMYRRWVVETGARFPPGPLALPIIGHLHLLSNLPHRSLAKLSKKYGDSVGLRLGQRLGVVVSSPELAREVLVTHDKILANRPPYESTSSMFYGSQNSIFFGSYGPAWRKLRKICTLELFTSKRLQEMEFVRQEEMATFLHSISVQSQGGSAAVDLGKSVAAMSSRTLMRLIHSQPTQPQGENLYSLFREMEQLTAPTVGDLIPFLRCLDFIPRSRMRHLHDRIDHVVTMIMTERKKAVSQCVRLGLPQHDLLDALLAREVGRASSPLQDTLTMEEMKSIMLDMLGGSIHTTALTIEWAMAELLKNPHCLKKLQEEIDIVVGLKEQVSDSDLPRLSYLRCVVKEVLRLHPLVPLLIQRISSQEIELGSYTLPANTHVFVNVWAIGRDEQVWKNASQFIPERFEENDVDLKGHHFELLPFGSGRRMCIGLPLGLTILEGTLANLVFKFNWELPPGETCASINMDEKRGITMNKATPTIARV